MSDTPSIDELAKAAELAERLEQVALEAEVASWQRQDIHSLGIGANLCREAADLIRSLSSRVEALEGALKEFSCSCPGACEREKNNTYAEKDSSCRAHDALSTPKPDGGK